ncbi:Pentatricopeptide repeat-containing protein [Abeliophyllum distichum]|uniref:Pentatricopeptide repeat-containing protein n=1 Tax=Abeliophyllum distichum TaxID=126358 RepID=A0ABD1RX40_9LAMI
MLNLFPPKIKPILNDKSLLPFLLSSKTRAFSSSHSSSSLYISNLITGILNSKNPKQALKLFNSVSRTINPLKTLKLHSAVTYRLTDAKLYVNARCLLKDLIETLLKNRKSHKVCSSIFNAFMQFEGAGSNTNVFGVLIIALCEKGLVDEAYWVYRKIGRLPAIQACNAILDGFLKAGRVEFMWEVYGLMVSNGMLPTDVSYGILIDACCGLGDNERSNMLFDEMVEKGFETDSCDLHDTDPWPV